jgi:transcriptional regulator with GAF, ATPase, and Fis domain
MQLSVVRFRFLGEDGACELRIRKALASLGIQLTDFETPCPQPCAIVCFAQIDNDLLKSLRSFRTEIGGRVLAVAICASALEDSGVWRLLHAGAADVMIWTGDSSADQISAKVERWQTIEQLTKEAFAKEPLAGESAAWRGLVSRVVDAGTFGNAPMLLTGESGTGKELLAHLLHSVSNNKDPIGTPPELVTVDCSTIVPELSGSELFGHEKGAFTGAHSARDGAFALAHGSTLFLDEIGELSLPLQVQLLRAIQEKTYKRVGGNIWLKTNFRLVCATNRDLEDLVRHGKFRLDLYHRIAGWVFRTISLAERREDILPLARFFLSKIFPNKQPHLDTPVCDYLVNREYEGNVRELRQLIERMAHRYAGVGLITVGDIPEEDRPSNSNVVHAWPSERLDQTICDAIATSASLRQISAATTDAAIRIAVQLEHGNLQRAAKRLGVTDRALQMRRAAGISRASESACPIGQRGTNANGVSTA